MASPMEAEGSCVLPAARGPGLGAEKMADLVRRACLASPALSDLFPNSGASTAPGTAAPSELASDDEASDDEFTSEAPPSDRFRGTALDGLFGAAAEEEPSDVLVRASPRRWRLVGLRLASVFREAAEEQLDDMLVHAEANAVGSEDQRGGVCVSSAGRDWRLVGQRLASVFRKASEELDMDEDAGLGKLLGDSPFFPGASESTDTPSAAPESDATSESDERSGSEWQLIGQRLASVFRDTPFVGDEGD